jgi:hypothetical protein
MPTPSQPTLTLDTKFGPVELRDARHFQDQDRDALAYFIFPDEIEVNRKPYKGVRFSLKRGYSSDDPFYITQDNGYYRDMTDSARKKIADALAEHKDKFGPYFEDLDDDTKRAQRKSKLRYELKQGIYKVAPNDHYPDADTPILTELIDEIMGEIMAERASGKTWGQIYFDMD